MAVTCGNSVHFTLSRTCVFVPLKALDVIYVLVLYNKSNKKVLLNNAYLMEEKGRTEQILICTL